MQSRRRMVDALVQAREQERAVALNPEFQARMKELLAKVAPGGTYDPAKVGEYVERFKAVTVTDPKVTFAVRGEYDGKRVRLTGETSDRSYHGRLITSRVSSPSEPSGEMILRTRARPAAGASSSAARSRAACRGVRNQSSAAP